MPRRIAATVVALLLWSPLSIKAQDWGAGVDPRIELMGILFRLAGNPEYNQCRIPAYDKAVASWFAPYRDHEAVRLARGLGIGFDAPVKLAVYLTDVDSLAERVPFNSPSIHLYQGWNAAKARAFLKAARAFASDAKFKEFLASQQPLFQTTNTRLQALVKAQTDMAWFAEFFGSGRPGRYVIVPGMIDGTSSYAARFTGPGGADEVYVIPGVTSVDAAGMPIFDSNWRNAMVHELAYSYCGPLVDKFAPQMAVAARQSLEQAPDAVRSQTQGSWKAMIDSSLMRAVAVRYIIAHDTADAASGIIRQSNANSFFWTSDLSDLLGDYEKNRQQYPTFESFIPRVEQFFDDLAPRMKDLAARYQPRVVSIMPADGAQDIDPSVKEIVVLFNMPMSQEARHKDPRFLVPRFDETGTVLTLPVVLESNHDYEIPLRWPGGQPFVSADGVTLAGVTIHFRTRAASVTASQ